MNAMDEFFERQDEQVKACLLALKAIILKEDKEIIFAWKYGMPFFCYKGRMFCYLWVHKKNGQPYLGIVEGKHIQHPESDPGKTLQNEDHVFRPWEGSSINSHQEHIETGTGPVPKRYRCRKSLIAAIVTFFRKKSR